MSNSNSQSYQNQPSQQFQQPQYNAPNPYHSPQLNPASSQSNLLGSNNNNYTGGLNTPINTSFSLLRSGSGNGYMNSPVDGSFYNNGNSNTNGNGVNGRGGNNNNNYFF
ncbi:unnamed protein product [Ambrosiozyma monospora]|uniref:Unnamed protein product n=1 Tax=Ambrosiozyma monospora TaxID=43982 RepID=A0ACB5TCV2_AMBMO|nr:unnamed protein product [Ambrosiozyma monospora]